MIRLKYFILECQRIDGIATLNFNQRVYESFEIDGETFWKGQDLVYNIHALHHDPDQWKNPEKFIPDRFDPNSDYFLTPAGTPRSTFSFMPFSIGPRSCPGSLFAMLELKVFLIMMILYKKWRLDET